MTYYHSTIVSDLTFDEAVSKTTAALKKEGFGVLTEIDIKATLKKKLGIDFHNYKILGACNPGFAHKALIAEDKIGTLLPCNVILQEKQDNFIEVSAVDPMASMQAVINKDLMQIADDVSEQLKKVIDAIHLNQ